MVSFDLQVQMIEIIGVSGSRNAAENESPEIERVRGQNKLGNNAFEIM